MAGIDLSGAPVIAHVHRQRVVYTGNEAVGAFARRDRATAIIAVLWAIETIEFRP
jgi:hypothetical protein